MSTVKQLELVTKRVKALTIVIRKKELLYSDIVFINNYLISKKFNFFIKPVPNKGYEVIYTAQSITKIGFGVNNEYSEISYDCVYSKSNSSSYLIVYKTLDFIDSRLKNYDSNKTLIIDTSNRELEPLQLDIVFNESNFLYVKNYVNTHLFNLTIDKDELNNLTILTDTDYKVELKNWYRKLRLKIYLKTNLKAIIK